jgi:hypothetical protein
MWVGCWECVLVMWRYIIEEIAKKRAKAPGRHNVPQKEDHILLKDVSNNSVGGVCLLMVSVDVCWDWPQLFDKHLELAKIC